VTNRTGYQFASSRVRHARSDAQRMHHAERSVARGVRRLDAKRRLTFTLHQERSR
jgi:hypothetical protein